jgi:hypothetical protein
VSAPGWYPDVRQPGWLRYWDGATWTEHRSPIPLDPGAAEGARSSARTARVALAVGTPLMVISTVATGHAMRTLREQFEEVLDEIERTPPGQPVEIDGGTIGTDWNVLTQLPWLVTLVVGILFMVWLHRAARVADRLGIPHRYDSHWAWLGFLVPIANLFVPYVVARDTLPRGDPGRTEVTWWWASYLVASLSVVAMFVAALVGGGALFVVTGVSAIAWVVAGISAWRMIGAVLDAHAR